jgi:dihydrofolate reductase
MEVTMKKLINSTYITLDGAVEGPHLWPSLGASAQAASHDIQMELLNACDVILMGHHTYDIFASAWPTRSGDMADRMNAMQKQVVSTTLRDPAWNNTKVIGTDAVEKIRALKKQPGKDIVQYGLGEVSFTLLEHGLLDVVRWWIQAIILGKKGPVCPLFVNSVPTQFDLVGSRVLSNGVVIVNYKCKREA